MMTQVHAEAFNINLCCVWWNKCSLFSN